MNAAVLRLALLLALLLFGAVRADATSVAGAVRVAATADGVQLRLALSQPLTTPPETFALGNPDRLVIDLGGASSERRDATGGGEVRSVRVSQFDPQTVRIVVDLFQPMRIIWVAQGLDNVLEVQLRRSDAATFANQRRQGRRPVEGFVAQTLKVVPPGPQAPPDLRAQSTSKLADIEAVLAEAERQASAPSPAPPSAASTTAAAPTAERRPPVFTPPPAIAEAPPATLSKRKPRSNGRFLVVLDAGHGGKDPGAPSVSGGNEKDVTLAIALAAKRAIERQARASGRAVDVRLTRSDDRFVTLGGRVRLARDWGADLFVSIHADSAPNAMAEGATVYTLSDVASDRESARVAAKENRADLIVGVDLSGEDREVANILVTLGMRDSMNASADFAQLLQKSMAGQGVPFRSNYHRFAGFQVLRNLGVPAVLLETGYMSNEADSKRLFSARGQRDIADGLADAVVAWASAGR